MELPEGDNLGGLLPDELALVDPSSSPTPESSPSPDDSQSKERTKFDVPGWKPQEPEWGLPETPSSTPNHASSGPSNHQARRGEVPNGYDPSICVNRDGGGDTHYDGQGRDDHDDHDYHADPEHQMAYMRALPDARFPKDTYDRQPHLESQLYASPSQSGKYQAFNTDYLVHFAQTIKNLTNNEVVAIDFVSPNDKANKTSRNTAASLVVTYRGSGTSPSALNSTYTMEWKLFDVRHPGGRVVYSKSEGMLLSSLKIHGAVACRDLGDWQITTTRNGTKLSTDTLTVQELQPPSGWSRRVNSAFKSISGPYIAYTTDDGVANNSTYTIPDFPAGQPEQVFKVRWRFISPEACYNKVHGSFTEIEKTYRTNGSIWNTTTIVKDDPYHHGRTTVEQGSGTLSSLSLARTVGFPDAGDWKFEEKIGSAASQTTTLSVRHLSSDVKSLINGSYVDTGAVPFQLHFKTSPPTWIPDEVDWTLKIVGGNGNVLQTYSGKFTGNTDSEKTWVQTWDGKSGGNPVPLGSGVSTVLSLSVPPPTPAAPALQKRLSSNLTKRVMNCTQPPADVVSTAPVASRLNRALVSAAATPPPATQLTPNADGSYGNPGDTWVLTLDTDASVGLTHTGRMSVIVNVPGATYSDPANGDLGKVVAQSPAVYTELTADPPLTFQIPGGETFYNYRIQFTDSSGTVFFADMISAGLVFTDLTQGAQIYSVGFPADPGSIFSTSFAWFPFAIPYPPVDTIPPDVLQELEDELTSLLTCECTSSTQSLVPQCTGMSSPIPISVLNGSGRYKHSFTDLAIPTRGLPLVLSRIYSSDQQKTAPRFGWDWSFQERLTIEPNSGTVFHIGV